MEFVLFDGRGDGGHNRVSFVEMSNIFVTGGNYCDDYGSILMKDIMKDVHLVSAHVCL